jgi:hypothetical protein
MARHSNHFITMSDPNNEFLDALADERDEHEAARRIFRGVVRKRDEADEPDDEE